MDLIVLQNISCSFNINAFCSIQFNFIQVITVEQTHFLERTLEQDEALTHFVCFPTTLDRDPIKDLYASKKGLSRPTLSEQKLS